MPYKLKEDAFIGGEYRKKGYVVDKIPEGFDKKVLEEIKKEQPDESGKK